MNSRSQKILLLSLLFVFQTIHEFTMENFISNIPDYNNEKAMSIAVWSSIPAMVLSAMWCSIMKINSETPNKLATTSIAISTYVGSSFSLVALKYVPYPIRIVSKSCKPVFVAICKHITGNTMPAKKVLPGISVIAGSVIFSLNKLTSKTNEYSIDYYYCIGLLCLLISLMVDGTTGVIEDKYLRKSKLNPAVTMFYTHSTRTIIFVPLAFALKLHAILYSIILYNYQCFLLVSLTSPLGQLALFYSLAEYGAYNTLIVTTIRKAFSIAISMYYHNRSLHVNHFVGLLFYFYGLFVFIPEKKKQVVQYQKLDEIV